LLCFTIASSGIPHLSSLATQPESQTLFQVEKGVELENIAVRSDGRLLATGISRPVVFQFNPAFDTTPTELVSIPGVNSLFGIAEISPDVFAIAAGNFTRVPQSSTPGSFSVWCVNLQSPEPVVSKLLDFPNSGFLNGMAVIPANEEGANATILISDTAKGQIVHLDATTLSTAVVLNETADANNTVSPGINGMRFRVENQTLYYTNTILAVFCSVKLSISYSDSGDLPSISAAGPFTTIASKIPGDDFALAVDGTAFIGANPINTVYKVTPTGNVTEFLGSRNSTVVNGASSAAFGRALTDTEMLYVTTNGILPLEANATSEGGKVIAVSTRENGVVGFGHDC
jgi:hypothetical protein